MEMQTTIEEHVPKVCLTQGRESVRKTFYADNPTLTRLESIKSFYAEMLGGREVSISVILRRAVEGLEGELKGQADDDFGRIMEVTRLFKDEGAIASE